jgi:hypothetical protein
MQHFNYYIGNRSIATKTGKEGIKNKNFRLRFYRKS